MSEAPQADSAKVSAFVHETVTRPATAQDWPFITSSWLRSYRHSAAAAHVPPAIYFKEQHSVIDWIMANDGVCRVIAMADQSDVVLGFVCFDYGATHCWVHYLYVKLAFRRIGLATKLLSDIPEPKIVTHLTHAGLRFKLARMPKAEYNPYVLYAS